MKKICNVLFLILTTFSVSNVVAQDSWVLSGNSNAAYSSFIGTTNSMPLIFKTNNTIRMGILSDKAFIGVGTSTPVANMHIHGNVTYPKTQNVFLMTNPSTGSTLDDGFRILQSASVVTISQQEKSNLNIFNNNKGITIDTNGYVGFNTTLSKQKLHVVDNNILISRTSTRAPGSRNGSLLFGGEVSDDCPFGSWGIEYLNEETGSTGLNFWKPWGCDGANGFNYALFLSDSGNVGIGTNNPLAKLTVNGNICAKEVRVSLSGAPCWPDYVFEADYPLLPLNELRDYLTANKHLPDIPAAKEVEGVGIELGEMNATLLRKIEEMTLYILQLEQRIADLEEKGGVK